MVYVAYSSRETILVGKWGQELKIASYIHSQEQTE